MLSFWFAAIYMFIYSVTFASLCFWYFRRVIREIERKNATTQPTLPVPAVPVIMVKDTAKDRRSVCPNCKGLKKVNLVSSQIWVPCTMCNGKGYIERFV